MQLVGNCMVNIWHRSKQARITQQRTTINLMQNKKSRKDKTKNLKKLIQKMRNIKLNQVIKFILKKN